eukprot:4661321-Amphidinium_carterae.1
MEAVWLWSTSPFAGGQSCTMLAMSERVSHTIACSSDFVLFHKVGACRCGAQDATRAPHSFAHLEFGHVGGYERT